MMNGMDKLVEMDKTDQICNIVGELLYRLTVWRAEVREFTTLAKEISGILVMKRGRTKMMGGTAHLAVLRLAPPFLFVLEMAAGSKMLSTLVVKQAGGCTPLGRERVG